MLLRRIMDVPGGIAHYVVGSAYVVAQLLTFERRARDLELAPSSPES